MNLCLSCHHLSPSDSVYCSICGRTFGIKVCHGKKHHHNPMDAQVCVHCGNQDLTEPTLYLPFGWFTRLLTWGTVLLLLWWLGPRVVSGAATRASHSQSLMGLLNAGLHLGIALVLWYWLLLWMVSLVPGEGGKQLRNLITGTANLLTKQGFRFIVGLVKGAFHLLHSGIEGNKSGKS